MHGSALPRIRHRLPLFFSRGRLRLRRGRGLWSACPLAFRLLIDDAHTRPIRQCFILLLLRGLNRLGRKNGDDRPALRVIINERRYRVAVCIIINWLISRRIQPLRRFLLLIFLISHDNSFLL